MSTIQDTAYPQLKKDLSARDLSAIYTPTTDECAFAVSVSARKPTQVLLLIQLKILQRLGYFERKRPPSSPSPIARNPLHYAPHKPGAKRWASKAWNRRCQRGGW